MFRAAVVAAGLYQLTPLKETCLRHCRGPLRRLLLGPEMDDGGVAPMEHGGCPTR
jgi:predicted metal-binding membrane protein